MCLVRSVPIAISPMKQSALLLRSVCLAIAHLLDVQTSWILVRLAQRTPIVVLITVIQTQRGVH
jgi:hypothetical protein